MSDLKTAAEELASVYEDYFELSKSLQIDLDRILDNQHDDLPWRRNFIRSAWPMIEAYGNTLRELCVVLEKHSVFERTKSQKKLLQDERSFSTEVRIKETLKLAFRVHELDHQPAFNGEEWLRVRQSIGIRDRLVHPKTSQDMVIGENEWNAAFEGTKWLLVTLFSFFDQVQDKYGPNT